MPPKAPANFTKELESKHFTTGRVDHDFVNKKYENTFLEVRPDLSHSVRAQFVLLAFSSQSFVGSNS